MLTIPLPHRFANARHTDERLPDTSACFEALERLERRRAPLTHLDGAHCREVLATWFDRRRDVSAWRSRIVYLAIEEACAGDLSSLCLAFSEVFMAMQGDDLKGEGASLGRSVEGVIDFADMHGLDVVIGHAERLCSQVRQQLSSALVAHTHAARWFWLWEDGPVMGVEGEPIATRQGGEERVEEEWEDGGNEDLDEDEWRLLMVLSRQDYTMVERDALTALGLSSQISKRLRGRGLIEVLPSGLALTERGARLRDRRRGPKLGPRDASMMRAFVQRLCAIEETRDEIARHLDAFECAITHGLVEEVEAILSTSFEPFRRADLLMRVYGRLLDANEPRLRTWLFRASCYMSDFDRAESLRWREDLELEDAMYWLYLLLNRGRYDQLQEMANTWLARHERETMTREERMCCEQIRLLQARAFMQTSEHARALEVLEPVLATSDRWMGLNARFVQIRALAYSGQIARGRALLPSLVEEVEACSLSEQRKWAIFMIQTCYVLKMYGESEGLARRCFGDGASLNHLKSTAPILLGALWVEVGDREQARRAIDFAHEAFRQSPAMLSMLVNIDLADAIARGDVPRMRAALEAFEALQVHQISEVSRSEHHALQKMAWLLFGWRLQGMTPPFVAHEPAPSAFTRCMDELWQMKVGPTQERVQQRGDEAAVLEGDEESYLFEVWRRAWSGAVRGHCAIDEVERAVLIARQCAMRRMGQELAQMYCIQSYLFHPARLDRAIGELEELARRSASERFLQEVSWWRVVQRGHVLSVHELERLADTCATSSLASQIIARLLGELERSRLGPLEELLAKKVGEQLLEDHVLVTPSHTAQRSPRLVLHLDDGEVWLPGSKQARSLVLDREQVGFALLRHLAEEGPEHGVEKEQLIKRVWQEIEEYHPLRHDNRLRVAIRKLRKELREGLGEEDWIQTTASGYAIGCPVRIVERKSCP